MDGRSPALMNCSDHPNLPSLHDLQPAFVSSIGRKIWRVDALLVTEAILAGIIVGVGAYGQRYRYHPFTRFIFLGATTLFLPIVSSVVSTISNSNTPCYLKKCERDGGFDDAGLYALVATCHASNHSSVLIVWALLVQIVMVNTSTVAATEEGREGPSVTGPPIDLIVQGVWTIYLGVTLEGHDLADDYFSLFVLLIAPFVLLCAKIVLKFYAFEKARRSFALGRNPGLTFLYMEKLKIQEASQQSVVVDCCDPPPPALLVMGEEEKQVEIQPCGYAFKDDYSGTVNSTGLVTFDRVWQVDSMPRILSPQIKGLCLSYALFKLLRCRFSMYRLTNGGSTGTLSFFRSLSLQYGEHDKIFRVIADELSFVHDYYYSSLPISYSKCFLPILNILLSLLSISYCILLALFLIIILVYSTGRSYHLNQIGCDIWWIQGYSVACHRRYRFGTFLFDLVLLLLLPVLVLMVEVRETASYICSNWTKVTLICRHVKDHTSTQRSLGMEKWAISLLLRCSCKLIMKQHWNEKMSQCSLLVLNRKTALQTSVRRLLPLPDRKWNVKVKAPVKVCTINALRSVIDGNGSLSRGAASLSRSQFGESFLWACDGKGTSDTILVWHIATSIVQVKTERKQGGTGISSSEHKTVATQLSQYCAYLMSWCPELLPDNNAWSTSLYKDVKNDAEGALARYCMAEEAESSSTAEHPVADQPWTREDGYQKLVRLLSDNSKHEVLRDGVKLGKQLVEMETNNDDVEEAMLWELLAEFWSEMVLYLAPSDNLKGHSEAIARGGEMITLLWALLFHAGIVCRPGEDKGTAAAASSAGAV